MRQIIQSLLLLVIAFCLNESICSAQEYHPFVKEDAVWTQATTAIWPDFSGFHGYSKYSFVGDTTINDTTYNKMYRVFEQLDFDINDATYFNAFREEDEKVFIRLSDGNEYLFFDFSLSVGDSTTIYGQDLFGSWNSIDYRNLKIGINSIDSILIGDTYRKRFQVQYNLSEYGFNISPSWTTEYWIEGIGSTWGISKYFDHWFIADIGYPTLICYEEADATDVLYQYNGASSCEQGSPINVWDVGIQDDTICLGQTAGIYYEYYGGNGTDVVLEPNEDNSNIGNFGLSVSPSETTTYTLSIGDLTGDTIQYEFTVFVIQEEIEMPTILFDNPSNQCYPDSLTMYVEGDYAAYEWSDYGGGEVYSTDSAFTIYEGGEIYRITVYNEAGCSAFDGISFYQDPLNTNPAPIINYNFGDNQCYGDTITFTTEKSYATYLWSTGETTPTIQAVLEPGWHTFNVQVTDENGCFGVSSSYTFRVRDYPEIPIIAQDAQNAALLNISNATDAMYQWFLNGDSIPGATDTIYEALEAGIYSVEVSNSIYDECNSYSEDFVILESEIAKNVSLKVFLEGAYDDDLQAMKTNLLDLNLLPVDQPYNTAPWNYNGFESVAYTGFPTNTVDWILVEARTGTPQINGQPGTTGIQTKAALLLSDGSIVDTNGEALNFNDMIGGDDYYFVIRHRNHLDIISSTALTAQSSMQYDFTTNANQAFGTEQQKNLSASDAGMFAADYNYNGDIQTTDYDEWRASPAINQVYSTIDGNMDGIVQVTDKDIWFINRAKLGTLEIRY